MRRLTLLALAVGATAILAACGSSSSSALTGKNWQLTSITEKTPAFQGVVPPADQERYQITFNTDGTFNGTADCNQFGGTYKTRGSDKLEITPGISTMAMCPDGSLDLIFVHGLSQASTYAIANDTLTITLTDESTMTLVVGVAAGSTPAASAAAGASATAAASAKPTAKPTATPTAKPTAAPTAKPTTAPTTGPTTAPTAKPTAAPTAAPTATPAPIPGTGLIGKAWQLTAITVKVPAFQGAVPADQQANYTVEFKSDGTFSAKADCNNLSGTFTTADPNTSSGDLALVVGPVSLAACADGSYSDLYILALTNTASYAIASNQLTITLKDEGTLTYK